MVDREPPPQPETPAGAPAPLGRRTLTALLWSMGASPLRVVLLFVRMLILMDLLAVETFGVFAKALAITASTVLLAGFGMRAAFLNRTPETEDETRAAAVLFTMKLVGTTLWAIVLIVATWRFATGGLRLALLVLTGTTAAAQVADMPRQVLQRRVVHRRLVAADLLAALVSAVVAVSLAWRDWELWALLGGEIAAVGTALVCFFLWRPPWRPRLGWDPAIARYYLSFGSRNVPNAILMRAIDYVDDLWTGFALGDYALGVYSRAYRFATYPRTLIALPTNAVAQGTFAELKTEREQLSKAFFRIAATLVRTGFLFVGALVLVAPEFVRIAFDDKWLPMIQPFRWMLVYALLDPLRVLMAGMLTATGHPGRVLLSHALQLGVLVVAVPILGTRLGVEGVALAVNLMALAGIVAIFLLARPFVDFSHRALWLAPSLGLTLGVAAGAASTRFPWVAGHDLRSGSMKLLAFLLTYGLVLLLLERKRLEQLYHRTMAHLRPAPPAENGP